MQKIEDQILLTKNFDVHQDWYIPIPGFFILAAKDESRRSIMDFSDDELLDLAITLKKVRTAMRDALGVADVYLFQNEDTHHGFHIWIFPRYEWMNEFGTKIQSVRPIMEFAKENMMTEQALREVKEAAQKVRILLNRI